MRGDDVEVVDQVLAADARRRTSLTDFEQARAEQKSLGREVAQAKGDEKAVLLARTKDLAQQVKALQAAADAAGAEARELLMSIGNLAEPGVPAGGADDFTVLREEGTPRDFASEGVTVRDHLELGEGLKAIDMERGAKVSGARFYFLTGVGAQLELAILNAAMGVATANGFSPMITPTLVRPETMRGTGFLGSHSDEVYYLEKDELYLTGTSEVALAGYHTDEILDLNEGPLRYAGWSACYRREAGSAGRDTRGIIRVHQFHKVEMFSYVRSEDAAAEHERFLTIQESMLKALELPYRVIDTAAGPRPPESLTARHGSPARNGGWSSPPRRTARRSRRGGLPFGSAARMGPGRWRPLTAPSAPPAGSWHCWRTTSRRTVASTSPRCCALTWAARSC